MTKKQWLLPVMAIVFFSACRQSYNLSTLSPGYYQLHNNTDSVLITEDTYGDEVFVEDKTDSLLITFVNDTFSLKTIVYPLEGKPPVYLHIHSFDADIFTVPFKLRPAASGIPLQLDANFHVAFYAGRRHDFYKLSTIKAPNGRYYRNTHRAEFGYGVFLGMAAATMRPEYMGGNINYEYEGLSANAGVAGIFDIGAVNVGVAIGIDKLLDKNRSYWIYQHKPWFGVLLGINLN